MLQEKIAVRHPFVPFGPWIDQNLAASQTNADLVLGAASDQSGILMPNNCYVVGIAIQTTAASTAGNLTVGVTVDGTEDSGTTQAITTATETYKKFEVGNDAPYVEAGESIGVEITTDGDWTAETMDLAVWLFVVFVDWEI